MKKLFLSFFLFSTLTFSQDAIEVSPSTLDFGNVLMGNTPSLTFTINCNLDQTITITRILKKIVMNISILLIEMNPEELAAFFLII